MVVEEESKKRAQLEVGHGTVGKVDGIRVIELNSFGVAR